MGKIDRYETTSRHNHVQSVCIQLLLHISCVVTRNYAMGRVMQARLSRYLVLILHSSDVIMSAMASQSTCVFIVCSTVCSSADQRKHQNTASLAFVRGIHRWPVDSAHKGLVTRKMFPFDDAIMRWERNQLTIQSHSHDPTQILIPATIDEIKAQIKIWLTRSPGDGGALYSRLGDICHISSNL